MAYGRNRMARNRITTTTSGTTFHHVFIPAANRIIVIVLSVAFAIMMACYNYLVNLAIVRMPSANVIAPVRFSLVFQIPIFVSMAGHVFMLTTRIEY